MTYKTLGLRIVELLESRPRDTFQPKQVARILHEKVNSVRTKMCYLAYANKVIKVAKALYQSPQGLICQEYDPQIRFHGIKFEHRRLVGMAWCYLDLNKIVTEQLRTPWIHRHSVNKSIVTTSDWEGRDLTMTLHPEKEDGSCLLEVFNHSSILPLHPLEFGSYCGYLQGVFKIPSAFWTLRQLGINIDRESTELDGWTNISMKVAMNNVVRMYQKAKDLRIEAHITTKVSAKECLTYMEGILRYAEILKSKEG